MTYLTVDPSFPHPFSVSSYIDSTSLNGPGSETFFINFTDSTGVILDMTHENVLLAFQHSFDITAYYGCWGVDIDFSLANGSFYQVDVSSTCELVVWGFGFSRIIFDKTAIEADGLQFFSYGTITSTNSNNSPF